MGSCLSKKGSSPSSVNTATSPPSDLTCKAKKEEDEGERKKALQTQEIVNKEIFLIKHRKSHEIRPEERGAGGNTVKDDCISNGSNANSINGGGSGTAVATVGISSCTKEEVDAILIQCGRLSRSSSGKVPGSSENSNNNNSRGLCSNGSKKYSGSKRSYDFDHDDSYKKGSNVDADDEAEEEDEEKQQLYQRQSRSSRSHRRTPSREKDVDYKRSSSRDRISSSSGEEKKRTGGGGRRVSRSPGRRSETPTIATVPASNTGPDKSRPGRMVSVPASVSTKEKTNSLPDSATGIKRVSVKTGGEIGCGQRTAASPRSQSPANTRVSNDNGHRSQSPANTRVSNDNAQQVPSLSRNSSKKAERSPYRRNPMSEIDENILRNEQCTLRAGQDLINNNSKAISNKLQRNKEGAEEGLIKKPSQFQCQKPDGRNSGVFTEHPQGIKVTNDKNIRGLRENKATGSKAKEQQQTVEEQPLEYQRTMAAKCRDVTVTAGATGANSLKPQTVTRSRSSRMSRDLDLNHDSLLNPASYASTLLEDIQNFHQQNTTGFSLPPCISKACSILEAVADLNSCTSSNLSSVFSKDRSESDRSHKNFISNSHIGRRMETKDPFLESEVGVTNDQMDLSLYKYVTVKRGVMEGEMEQQESSGSNNYSFLESEVGVTNDLMEPGLHKFVTVKRGVMEGEMEQQESSGSNYYS